VRLLNSAAGRTVVAFAGALILLPVGIALVIYTGSVLLGWVLVPGGMLAVSNMKSNEWARAWVWGGAIANVALWTLVLYVALDIFATRRRRERGPVA
jgi:hypothetical protein